MKASTADERDLPNRVYFRATPQVILAAARMHEVSWVEEISREAFPLNAESQVVVQSGTGTAAQIARAEAGGSSPTRMRISGP